MAKRVNRVRREIEREIARRFLSRAVRRVSRDQAFAMEVCGGDLGLAHKVELWRVVVAASHKSGQFNS